MEEEKIKTEIVMEEPIEAPTSREKLEERLKELLPEEKLSDDVEMTALDFINELVERRERMVEKIAENPRLAQVFADVVSGERKADAALARYFGKNLFTAEEGTPEYDELMAADEEYMMERGELNRMREEQNTNVAAWFDAFEQYLEKNGLDKDKYLAEVYEVLIKPTFDLTVDEKLFARLVKAVDYDKDVEDAFSAGEVKGRNTNINEMKGKLGDGMPKGVASQGFAEEQPKRRMNSLLAKALNA